MTVKELRDRMATAAGDAEVYVETGAAYDTLEAAFVDEDGDVVLRPAEDD